MIFTPLASSSKGNCYLLESDGASPLLLEAGIPIRQIRENLFRRGLVLTDLEGCLVSHEHGDHAKAVRDILKAGIDCYMSKGTAEAIGIKGCHRVNLFTGFHEIILGAEARWIVETFPLEHDAEEPRGFFIRGSDGKKLLFIPDTAFVRYRFADVNILAIECNHVAETLSHNIIEGHINTVVGRRVRRNHMSLETVIKMLQANDLSRCQEIWLLHLSDANSDEKKMIQTVQEATGIPCFVA